MTRSLTSILGHSSSPTERGDSVSVKSAEKSEKEESFNRWALDLAPRRATSKVAVADDTLHESEEDARKRRLGEMLRRRQRSGLDTGSATPTPPRDNS